MVPYTGDITHTHQENNYELQHTVPKGKIKRMDGRGGGINVKCMLSLFFNVAAICSVN